MKHTFVLVALLAALSATSQVFIEPKVGLSSRMNFTGYADIGYRFYNNLQITSTAGYEAGAGTSVGATAGWLPRAIMPYVGYGYFIASKSKMAEGSRFYPIAGIMWKDPDGKGVVDFRYMGDGFHFTMGFRLSKN